MDRNKLSYSRRIASRDASMIIIGYEGSKREPNYFKKVEDEFVESKIAFIHPLPPVNGESAPKKVLERVKTFVEDPSRGVNIEEGDHVWFVLDIDKYPQEQHRAVKKYCDEDKNRFLAISNPSFEVWLWMHFDDPDKIVSITSKDLKSELHDKSVGLAFNGSWNELIHEAITRGEKFDPNPDDFMPGQNCTKVYKLVQSLLNFSK